MIQGYVDKYLQAKVPIAVFDKNGNSSALEAAVDTGFTGDLCISIYEKAKIKLTFSHSQKFELGDGRVVKSDVFLGQMVFDKRKILVDVLVSKSKDTLIGAALLVKKKLDVDYTNKRVQIRNSRKRKHKRMKAVSR
jgi:clan AA aspartic protease